MFNKPKFTIGAKIMIGYFIILVCLGTSIFLLANRISSMQYEMNFIVDHDIEVHNLTNKIEKNVLDMETGQRGFALTGDEKYLIPYESARSAWESDYKNLYELITDNPSQQDELNKIRENIKEWIETAGQPVITMKRQNQNQEVIAFYEADPGKQIIDQLRLQLDDFRNTEKNLTKIRIADLDQKNAEFRIVLYVALFILIVLSVVLSTFISRSIVQTIKQVISAITDIASSEGSQKSKRINVKSKDEIRDLGEATNRLLERHENENWLQTSIGEVAVSYQGASELSDLSHAFTTKIAHLLEASYGVFYLRSGNYLIKTASYAASGPEAGTEQFQMGEGLVGQAALEKRIITLDSVPDDHVRIATGLGYSAPNSILIIPIEYKGEVQGVIEFASLHPFSDLQLKLVDQIRSTIGIAINSVLSQMEVKRLLEESQVMSEELQVQTEELKTQSEELISQQDEMKASNDSLKRSEERLQRQQEELEQNNLDLTQRTEQVEAHMRKIEEIKEQIEKQNYVLEKQASDLITASKYKSEFLANMSHELRTPLNSLLILSEILMSNKEGNLTTKQVDFSRTIHSSGNDLLRLIDDILDLSKVEAGQMKVEMEPVLLDDLKETLWRSFQPVALKKQIEFHIHMEENLPDSIITDSHRLQQILKNLLSNAIKFTSNGSVTLSLSRTHHTIPFVEHSTQSNMITFTVEDTGIGIPLDKRDTIFEAFQQADGSTSRKYGGTGLGLTISRELASLIGGYIEFDSVEGKGSTFTLYVPELQTAGHVTSQEIAVSDTVQVESKVSENVLVPHIEISNPDLLSDEDLKDDRHHLAPGDRVILIIEDDENFAEIMLDIARSRNFKGIVALQGDKGLALAHAYKPDAIMLDIQLPVIDGWTILERIKQHPELRHIPVHIISVVDESKQGLTMGAMAYLKKPVNKDQIEDALSQIESFINRDLKRLLIIEDDDVLRESMVELIGHDDVAITAVSTGAEALRELDREHFDCMVMDLGLSDISGFDLLDQIRRNENLKQLPIIIYTGKELDMREEIELKKYAESIIVKNVKSQERLFDETALFLHRVEANLPEDRRNILKKLYNNEDALEGKRILLIEDDIRNIFSLVSVLESYNLSVTFAENGREALEVLKQDPNFDLILTDIMMPEMDGYETMRAIRSMEEFHSLPIIALTAKAMKEDRQRCIDAGASDYISKPIDVEKLLSLLKVWLYT
ncbi:response regulator [Paenibacillus sp. Marseille-Q4541]|uniref:response regulator n=1 Tax=Paenibacillus sp. Marseille-Q4541 TaxID=2831522 RepID=UPI001BA795B8|nr:response regulator [Paenibacillus sp. Marseille-Q4541]